jgi:hypothetical protein
MKLRILPHHTVSTIAIDWDRRRYMLVRIRLKPGWSGPRRERASNQLALAVSALLSPSALMCGALALWRIGADLKLTGDFAITQGLFSRWQVWGVAALGLQAGAWVLNRHFRTGR